MNNKHHVHIASVVGFFGIKGAIKLKTFTEYPDDIFDFKEIYYLEDADIKSNIYLSPIRIKGDIATVYINGITDRNEAERFLSKKLYIDRSSLKSLAKEEYYYHDLIGLVVKNSSGEKIGIIDSLCNHGAGDILYIKLHDSQKIIAHPFTQKSVLNIEIKDRYIVIADSVT